MPYGFSTDRPETDAPVNKAKDPIRWINWANKNAPFTSVTTATWAATLAHQSDAPLPIDLRAVLAGGGTLTRAETERVLAKMDLPPAVHQVLSWAAEHNYGVRIEVTGDSVDQYLANASSASQH
jgi:hypothetical protein